MGLFDSLLSNFKGKEELDEEMSREDDWVDKELLAKSAAKREQERVRSSRRLPKEDDCHFVHELIPEAGCQILKAAGIDDDLVIEAGDWVADHDLGIYLVLYRFGSRTDWKKTYKLLLEGQVIEFKTKTVLHKDESSYEDGDFTKGLIVKNITNMQLPKEFEGVHQEVVHIIQAALSAASTSYDTLIYKVNFDLV